MNRYGQRLQRLDERRRDVLVRLLRAGPKDRSNLVAYVTQHPGSTLGPEDLRAFLAECLPEHMVPDYIEAIGTMPRLPNGKVDGHALAEIPLRSPGSGTDRVAPRFHEESILNRIWCDLLETDPIGVHDDFFRLGGDSLLSIRMVSMARQEGLHISPADLSEHPTIEKLAQTARRAKPTQAGSGARYAPVLPIQAWHLTRGLAKPSHWNQAKRFFLDARLTPEILESALDEVIAHHPGLRVTFTETDGRWQQALNDHTPFTLKVEDIGEETELLEVFDALAAEISIDCSLISARFLRFPAGRPPELILCVHHLAVDIVSWWILVEDLEAAAGALLEDRPFSLPPVSSSLDWALEIARYGGSPAARDDIAAWLSPLPPAEPAELGTEAEAGTLRAEIDPQTTSRLLEDANRAFNTKPLDLLTWALAEALRAEMGQTEIQIDFEGHGRDPDFSKMDLTRTIGWLTTVYPVNLRLDGQSLETRGKAVKEAIRRFAAHGASYGAMRYSGSEPSLATRLAAAQTARVLLNFGGLSAPSQARLLRLSEAPVTGLRAPENARPHLYEFNLEIRNGRLEVSLVHAMASETTGAAQRLLSSFVETCGTIVEVCTAGTTAGFTPSDFPETGFSQEELDAFLDDL